MNTVLDAFLRLIPSRHKRTGRGWITFNCPSPTCGDRRGRGGFRETANGFRYRCLNGGCEWEKSTGWEPDSGFHGRPKRLFEQMGGHINDIPIEVREAHSRPRDPTAALETANEFSQVSLPEESRLIWEPTDNKHIIDAQRYVLRRGSVFVESAFYWSPKYPRHVIYPFYYRRKIIGWIARKIDPGKEFAHIKCPNFPTDYMLNQDTAYKKGKGICLVQEGTFDAVALKSLCTFGNTISKKQINFLNQVKESGRKVVLLPDFQQNEWMAYWQTAKDNGWHLSVPHWPDSQLNNRIKDAGESIQRNGLLLTVEAIMNAITDDYVSAASILSMWS